MTRAGNYAIAIVVASLLLIPFSVRSQGVAAQDFTTWRLNLELRDCCPSSQAAHEFDMHARLELAVLADGTLSVSYASGFGGFAGGVKVAIGDVNQHRVYHLESVPVIIGRVPNPPDDGRGEAVVIIERIEFTFAPVSDKPEPIPNATVVLAPGPVELPASPFWGFTILPYIEVIAGDTTLSGEGTLRYRLVDRRSR